MDQEHDNLRLLNEHVSGKAASEFTHEPEMRPVDRLFLPIQPVFRHGLSGALLLLGSAIVAVILANSPFSHAYHELLHSDGIVGLGDAILSKSLHHWINDGLMGVFFFFVGLEIKREVLVGELSTLRKASFPAFGAVGGMLFPALVYVMVNMGSDGIVGWGIPMATDIAFALGVVALLGDRAPRGLKVFLTALAIVDDIGAVLVIALFYTDTVALISLFLGGALLLVSMVSNHLQVRSSVYYFVLGTLIWLAFLQSGIHATVAAILMAFTIPVRTRLDGIGFLKRMGQQLREFAKKDIPDNYSLNSHDTHEMLLRMNRTIEHASAPLQRLETGLAAPVTFIVLPIFALANAGVSLSLNMNEAMQSTVTLGVFLGLCVGKPVGILGCCWLAVRLKLADLPEGVRMIHVLGAGFLAGIGFTMALFISALAFSSLDMLNEAKLGVMAASVVAGVAGFLILHFAKVHDDQCALEAAKANER